MQDVHVTHVGGNSVIKDADFRTEGEGDLIVFRDQEVLAHFPVSKWSAAIKTNASRIRTGAV